MCLAALAGQLREPAQGWPRESSGKMRVDDAASPAHLSLKQHLPHGW
jgi:hypothetical protein